MLNKFIVMGITECLELQAPLLGLFLIIYMISVVGNLGMIILTKTDSRLQTPMYFFKHLAFTDLCYSTTVGLKMLVSFGVDEDTISYYFCTTQGDFYIMFIISERFIYQQCLITALWPSVTLCSTRSSGHKGHVRCW